MSRRGSQTVRFLKVSTTVGLAKASSAKYFYQQLHQQAEITRPLSRNERALADSFTKQHGLDTFREFVDYVIREKSTRWPDLATLTGAFGAFQDSFLQRKRERDAEQERAHREKQRQATEQKLNKAYGEYLESSLDRVKKQFPSRFDSFENEAVESDSYQECLATLRRTKDGGGPLAKAAKDQAERDRRNVFQEMFIQRFKPEGVMDFAEWRARYGDTAVKPNDIQK